MYNESFGSSLKRGYLSLPIAIRTIITINVVVFLVQVLGGSAVNNVMIEALAFNPALPTALIQPWRLVTYMFLHAGGFHLLFNMLWLWWMGRSVETTLGPRTFSVIFFGSGIGGALLDIAVAQFLGINLVIGASGSVFGVMVAFAMLFPRMPIMLFLLPPIEARYVVAGLIALDILFLGAADNTARIVHLGGAGVGYLLMRSQQRGFDLSGLIRPLENIWHELKNPFKRKKKKAKNKAGNLRSVTNADVVEETSDIELDRILEKISREGYDGLTKEEKRKLFELSKKN